MKHIQLNFLLAGLNTRKKAMDKSRLERIKKILSIPSISNQEKLVTEYLVDFCDRNKLEYIVDELGSVLVTKGVVKSDEKFPLFSSHIDTVHKLEEKNIVQHGNKLIAVNNVGIQCGLGADDLLGTAIICELLMLLPVCKAAFFVGEEIYCKGSKHSVVANKDWYNDVGYLLQYDGPELMITHKCNGTILFDIDGEFYKTIHPILKQTLGNQLKLYSHPYTDSCIIKEAFDFSCTNLFTGYYQWHSISENIKINEAEMAISMGIQLVQTLGLKKYSLKQK